jgi:hypothetical protein
MTNAGVVSIADNIIDEANLKASNGPTNGQFLSAQSGNTGGLTWAAAGGDLSFGGDTFGASKVVGSNDAYDFAFETNGITRLHIESAGKVGIGTTGPTELLSVNGTGTSITGTTVSTFSTQQDLNPRRGVMLGYDSSGQIGIISATTSAAAADLAFWSYPGAGQGGWTEKMRLKADGKLGLGTASFNSGTFMHVKKNASGAAFNSSYCDFVFENNSNTALNIAVPSNTEGHFGFQWPSYSQGAGCYTNSSSGSGYYAIQVHGGEKWKVTSAGVVSGAFGTYHQSSDARIKENVADITFGLSHVLQMRPVSFNFTDWYDRDGVQETRLGFIAQEVKAVVPNAVRVATQTVEFNYDDENDVRTVLHEPITDMHSIEDTQMIPILVKAIQELKAEVDELKG